MTRQQLPARRRLAVVLALVAVAALGCTTGPSGQTGQDSAGGGRTPSGPPSGTRLAQAQLGDPRVLVTNLEVPWGVGFLPGGDALVTERDSARLLRITQDGDVHEVATIEQVEPRGEAGLLGLAISPDFSSDRWVYLYYTTDDDNRIVRFRYRDGGLTDKQVLVSGIPAAAIHNGGRLAFGPDGMLYASTGEAGVGSRAQDLQSLGGKILRMTPSGEPAPGNPFDNSIVYSYGHRNVEGLAFGPDGQLYATEFGGSEWDEINLIKPGHNYGWPEVEGFSEDDRFTDPLLTWRPSEASPSGLEIAGGNLWVAALRGSRLWRVPLAEDGSLGEPSALFVDEYGRLRTVVRTPQGSLWVTTSNRDGRGDPGAKDDKILVLPLKP